jgi:transcriptional regulator with XRE-family HTH domain
MTTSKKRKTGIGTALRTLRKAAGLTLDQTKTLAGADAGYISKVENGVVTPSPTWIANLVGAIGEHMRDAA